MRISRVGGVIAAADHNNTQQQRSDAIPAIRRIIITFQQAGIFPIVIVTDAEDEAAKTQLSNYGVIFVQNTAEDTSELFSYVKAGLGFLADNCDRVMFTPVKVPMFTSTTLLTMMEREEEIVIASHRMHGGHPVLIGRNAIPGILAYKGENGLRGALSAGGFERTWVDVDDSGVLLKVNGYEELNARLEEHNAPVMHPVLHVRMEREEPFLDERLKTLLFLISDNYSIHKGCACTGLAYSKAWGMINQLEHNLGYAVVERKRGGKGGGGTCLTPDGERFLAAYQDFEETIHRIAQKEFRERFIDTNIIRAAGSDIR